LCVEPKQFHDVVGYYNRFDVFSLNVNRHRLRAADIGALDAEVPPQRVDAETVQDGAVLKVGE